MWRRVSMAGCVRHGGAVLEGVIRDHPQTTMPGQINTNHGGRGFYFKDPAGHGMEVITRPYTWPD